MISEIGCETADGLLNVHPEGQTCEVCAGTTNDDAPFQPGERVEWRGLVCTVVDNSGDGGIVESAPGNLHAWKWIANGAPVRRVSP